MFIKFSFNYALGAFQAYDAKTLLMYTFCSSHQFRLEESQNNDRLTFADYEMDSYEDKISRHNNHLYT